MKKFVFTLSLLVLAAGAMAQTTEESSEEVFGVVEHQPEYPGGMSALFKYIGNALVYPEEAKEKGIEGRAYVQFVIGKTGKVRNVKVLRSPSALFDEEATRVIEEMEDWKPGEQRGEIVAVKMIVPITFKL